MDHDWNEDVVVRALSFVKEREMHIQGMILPSGETISLAECFKRHPLTPRLIADMTLLAAEVIERENLTDTVYIASGSFGISRDDYTIGFRYPAQPEVEAHLNNTFRARQIRRWAENLPPEQREHYLKQFRARGLDGYL